MNVDLPYLSREVDRHGRARLYVRRYGRRIRIREPLDSPGFAAAYAEALQELAGRGPTKAAPTVQPHPRGSLGWLGAKYFASKEFGRLAPKSQATRRAILEECFREPYADDVMGNCPIAKFSVPKAKFLRNAKADLPGAANNRKKYVSALFSWAIEEGLATSNPMRDVRRIGYASSGFHTWTVEEVRQFQDRHPLGTKPFLALALLMFTGTRRGDMVTLGRQHISGGWLRFVPSKTLYRRRTMLELPLLPELADIIAASPCGDLTFLVTDYGRPFTPAGFGNWFRARCNEAGLPHCSAHGLRKAGATFAAERGATAPQLMAIYGWSTLAQAQRYIEAANRKRMAGEAMALLGVEKGTA